MSTAQLPVALYIRQHGSFLPTELTRGPWHPDAQHGGPPVARLSNSDGCSLITPDLTLYLHRHPVGEWVCLEAVPGVQPHGTGLAESKLYDETGPIRRSLQSLLVERS